MIPKIIHYCWFGGNPKPKLVKKCIRSWKKHCPDYKIIEWNESNYDVTKIPYMKAAYDAKKWGFATDYARLDIIYTHGGIYVDTDVELVKSYDSLLGYSGFAGFESEKYVNSGLGIGAEAGNFIIRRLMAKYETHSPYKKDGMLNLVTCPILDTDTLMEFGLKQDGINQVLNGNFVILPTEYLCPKTGTTGLLKKTKNTISIHHYDSSWYSEEEQKNKRKIWRQAKWEHIRYAPNRMLLRLLGSEKYAKLKNAYAKGTKNDTAIISNPKSTNRRD